MPLDSLGYMVQKYAYIIIGSSAAGVSAINQLARLDPTASILCITASNKVPYNTCFLVDILAGKKTVNEISLAIMSQNIQWKLSTKVISIDQSKKSIITSDNSEILYQKLLIATGVRPYLPPIAGITTPGVFTFHTMADVHALRAWINQRNVRSAIIIGAGLTGIECADALHMQGIVITMIEQQAYPLYKQITAEGAHIIIERMEQEDVSYFFNSTVIRIIERHGVVARVCLADGRDIAGDMVIIAIGVQPQSELGHHAGLVMYDNYIQVDDTMQTSDASIFAAGDVAMVQNNSPSCIWADAAHQGTIAAHAMTGISKSYTGSLSLINSQFFGLYFATMGMKDVQGDVIERKRQQGYVSIVFQNDIPVRLQCIDTQLANIVLFRKLVLLKKSPYFFSDIL